MSSLETNENNKINHMIFLLPFLKNFQIEVFKISCRPKSSEVFTCEI